MKIEAATWLSMTNISRVACWRFGLPAALALMLAAPPLAQALSPPRRGGGLDGGGTDGGTGGDRGTDGKTGDTTTPGGGGGTTPGGGGGGGGGQKGWSGPVGATVNLQVKMPPWTEGWLKAGAAWGDAPPVETTAEMTGRDIEATSHHVLLTRTKAGVDGPHSWKPAELAHSSQPWDSKVYRESWPSVKDLGGYQAGGAGESASGEDEEYKRFGRYVTWSD